MHLAPAPITEGPLFSVIIATYNYGCFIAETLDSVLAQACTDYEVIVVDDGSTDDTPAVIEPYLDRIRYVPLQHRGVAAAWNAGIRESRGKYIGFLAADDAWETRTLADVADTFAKSPEVGVVALTAREMCRDGELTGKIRGKKTSGDFYSTTGLLRGDTGAASFFFVRREVLENVALYDETLHSAEECDLLLRISFETKMLNLRKPLIRHREHANSLSRNMRSNAQCWIRILEKLASERPQFVQQNRLAYKRALGKESLRYGRETLALRDSDRAAWREARASLVRSILSYPFFPRAYVYLLWSIVTPSTFSEWRQRSIVRRMARFERRTVGSGSGR